MTWYVINAGSPCFSKDMAAYVFCVLVFAVPREY